MSLPKGRTLCVLILKYQTRLWTKFSQLNKTWAEFSIVDVGMFVYAMQYLHCNKTVELKVENLPQVVFKYSPFSNSLLGWSVVARGKRSSLFIRINQWRRKRFRSVETWAIVINLFTSVIYDCLYYAKAIFLVVCDPSMNELWAT